MNANPRLLHVWVPGLSETGGIQHYSWCLVKALREVYPTTRIVVFSRNDLPAHESGIDGIETQNFGHHTGMFRSLRFATRGLMAAVMQRPDLCIATHPAFARALRVLPVLGLSFVASAHGIEVWGEPLQRLRGALASAKMLLPVSEFTAGVMQREGGLDASRMTVLPDTLREGFFSPGPKPAALLARYGLRVNQPVLLTVGRLAASEAYKGQDQVIAALPAIRKVCPELRYIIAGCGDDEPRLRRCAAEHGQQDAVIFAGFVPDGELADYYRLCDAFVMPSTGEGFGIVYLEALASGRPCIVGDQDASPEAIGHGRLGFAVNPQSPVEIAEAVIKLITRQHDKPWLHEPDTLRKEVIALYGFEAFKRHLARALDQIQDLKSKI